VKTEECGKAKVKIGEETTDRVDYRRTAVTRKGCCCSHLASSGPALRIAFVTTSRMRSLSTPCLI
jgi:hypothetical protein